MEARIKTAAAEVRTSCRQRMRLELGMGFKALRSSPFWRIPNGMDTCGAFLVRVLLRLWIWFLLHSPFRPLWSQTPSWPAPVPIRIFALVLSACWPVKFVPGEDGSKAGSRKSGAGASEFASLRMSYADERKLGGLLLSWYCMYPFSVLLVTRDFVQIHEGCVSIPPRQSSKKSKTMRQAIRRDALARNQHRTAKTVFLQKGPGEFHVGGRESSDPFAALSHQVDPKRWFGFVDLKPGS